MVEEIFKNMHLQLSADDIRRIDEWKISRGMKSRTEAIRAMIRIVTTGNLDEDISDMKHGFSEKNKSGFMRPDSSNKDKNKNESVEEMIRKVVKEELSKIINNK